MPSHGSRRSLARAASEPLLLVGGIYSPSSSSVLRRGGSRRSSNSSSRSLLREASIRSLHSSNTSVPKARTITFAADVVFQPAVQQPHRARLGVWDPEDIDIGISAPTRAAFKSIHLPTSLHSPPKKKHKKKQPTSRLESHLHRVMKQHAEEVLELQELRDKANKLQGKNDLINHEIMKRDLMRASAVKIATLIHELGRTHKKYTAKVRSCRKNIDFCENEIKKLSLVLRQSKTKVRRSKLRRTLSMPHA